MKKTTRSSKTIYKDLEGNEIEVNDGNTFVTNMSYKCKCSYRVVKRRKMEEFKSGFVTVIGRTNVGKSSIINSLVGEKVSAIANKPQTTRTRIKGIINRENLQIIILDTQVFINQNQNLEIQW